MDELEKFSKEVAANIASLADDTDVQALSRIWMREVTRHKYAYNFRWMGRPIIQAPQDIVAMQELIWRVQPDLVIETGIAHGGSLIFYASMLELLGGNGRVIGIDIDIRAHNRAEIERHPMMKRLTLIQGSSVDEEIVAQVRALAGDAKSIMVVLDSNHTHEHVLRELELYAPFVTPGSYMVVFDTIIEDMPDEFFGDRPWGKGDNAKTAVWKFLETNDSFVIDKDIQHKLLITVAPDGYLQRVK